MIPDSLICWHVCCLQYSGVFFFSGCCGRCFRKTIIFYVMILRCCEDPACRSYFLPIVCIQVSRSLFRASTSAEWEFCSFVSSSFFGLCLWRRFQTALVPQYPVGFRLRRHFYSNDLFDGAHVFGFYLLVYLISWVCCHLKAHVWFDIQCFNCSMVACVWMLLCLWSHSRLVYTWWHHCFSLCSVRKILCLSICQVG